MFTSLLITPIRGWSYKVDGSLEANWTTKSAQVSPEQGELYCFYTVNVPYKEQPVESLGRFQFDRLNESTGPNKMTGYTVDTDSTKKLRYDELHKLSDELIDLDSAKELTFKRYAERLNDYKTNI